MGDLTKKPFLAFEKPFSLDPYHILTPRPPTPTPVTPMPDPEAQGQAKRRIIQQAQAASGRDSTILSSTDKLGG